MVKHTQTIRRQIAEVKLALKELKATRNLNINNSIVKKNKTHALIKLK